MENHYPNRIQLRHESPDFLDLPWDLPLLEWKDCCSDIIDVPHGISRHPVIFIRYQETLYALKELPDGVAGKEYDSLLSIEKLGLPVVKPIGFVEREMIKGKSSVLITQYLEKSLPYRLLLLKQELQRYREHLLDAIANLMVELHIAGVYWGDCSLSNTLFRRDAGKLQAYLVDAETVELYEKSLSPIMRHQDLEILEDNIDNEIAGIISDDIHIPDGNEVLILNTGAYIRLRYQELWDEIMREEIIRSGENYRIQNRIRLLNEMGFSVGDISLIPTRSGDELRLRVAVTDRNYHRRHLKELTGLDAEEFQARLLMNEIHELKATLSREKNTNFPITSAAEIWYQRIFIPIANQLQKYVSEQTTLIELYCQMLEHKWYLSEQAHHDVGHDFAVKDFIKKFLENTA